MSMLNKQQLCAELGVSESTVRRLEQLGMPYTPVGARSKRYELEECTAWLRENEGALHHKPTRAPSSDLWKRAKEFTAECRNLKLRAMPSEK